MNVLIVVLLSTVVVLGLVLVLRGRASDRVVANTLHGVIEEATAVVDGQEVRAIDEANPPYYQNYRGPHEGRERLRCTCHNEPFPDGARVLIWPIPGHPEGGVDLFCQRTVQEAQ